MARIKERLLAAAVARKRLSGAIPYRTIMDEYPIECVDADVHDLYDLIEHGPPVEGLCGAGRSKSEVHARQILNSVARPEP